MEGKGSEVKSWWVVGSFWNIFGGEVEVREGESGIVVD